MRLTLRRTDTHDLVSLAAATCSTGSPSARYSPSLQSEQPTSRRPAAASTVKRTVDIVLSTALLFASVPVLLFACIAIRIDSSGPCLFAQTRVGRNGRPFTMFKLRTMHAGNDDREHRDYLACLINGTAGNSGGMYKLKYDRRVTRVGRVLRRHSIDELPQLWNVLRGEMSMVGPRPCLPYEAALYDDTAIERLRLLPGLTGAWQVSGRCDLTFDEMIALDVDYVRGWTLSRDLQIIVKTPLVVLRGEGAA